MSNTPQAGRRGYYQPQSAQGGVILIVALVLLIVISVLAVTSLRNATSNESVAGTVRLNELAHQAAEIALRHCEASAVKVAKNNAGDTSSSEATYVTNLATTQITAAGTNSWETPATWDSNTDSKNFVIPLTLVNTAASVTYKRAPECRIELLSSGTGTTVGTIAGETPSFVITARAFGPEVPNGTGRPKGTEVWLQSTIEIGN